MAKEVGLLDAACKGDNNAISYYLKNRVDQVSSQGTEIVNTATGEIIDVQIGESIR